MIGITGKDGAGYRWMPPRAGMVRDGRLRVVPYVGERALRRWTVFNTVLVVAMCALFSGERLGFHAAWHEVFFRLALAAVAAEWLLRAPSLFARRTIEVDLPLRFEPVRQSQWVGLSWLCSTLIMAMVRVEPPVPMALWDGLIGAALAANLAVALSPQLSRWLLRRRGEG
jgi:hypothetical protein